MPCSSCGGTPDNSIWQVTFTNNGTKITKEVIGEQNARIEITRAGNGTMRKLK